MFLIFNWPGLIILILSAILYVFFQKTIPYSPSIAYLFLGSAFIAFDLLARLFIIKKYFPKIKAKGGNLFFIPVYVIGIICILLSIYFFFQKWFYFFFPSDIHQNATTNTPKKIPANSHSLFNNKIIVIKRIIKGTFLTSGTFVYINTNKKIDITSKPTASIHSFWNKNTNIPIKVIKGSILMKSPTFINILIILDLFIYKLFAFFVFAKINCSLIWEKLLISVKL